MFYRDIARTLSLYLWGLIIPLTPSLAIAIYCERIAAPNKYPQPHCTAAFSATIVIAFLLGLFLRWLGRKASGRFYRREALLLVLLVYFLTPAIGALPFLFNKTFSNPVDAYFEITSGLTTTGATVMEGKRIDITTGEEFPITKTFITGGKVSYTYYGTIAPVVDPKNKEVLYQGIEAVSPALLFWRSLTQWLGGGGIVVLFVAILPALGVGGKVLYQTEVTGPSKESMAPRIKETASWLWKIYLGLTALQVLLLMVTNKKMPLFDAITITFCTLSTGGFTVHNGSIGYYNNIATDNVIILFMILGGTSFSIYFFLMRGKFNRLKDSELRMFLLIVLFTVLFAAWQLTGKTMTFLVGDHRETSYSFLEALRYGAFQVISAQTSTGFATANFDVWPFPIQTLMLVLMFIGAMAGSTSGGLKVVRQQMFFRILLNKIETIFRPDTVRTYRLGTATIDNNVAITVLCYFMIAASLSILSTFLLVVDGVDPETSLSTVGCMINNVGLAFRMGGPLDSFAFLSNGGKLLSCFLMIAGRLEFFALLIAFVPAFWRPN